MRKLLIILFLFVSALSYGQYHVAKTGTDGAGVSGDLTHPWLTITYGESRVSGGDTLYVHTGTYTERLVIIGIDGTATARTVIRNYGTDAVIIDGQNAGTDSEGDIVRIYDDYVDLDGFELRNANQDKGVSVYLGIGIDNRGDHFTVSNCTIHETLNNGMQSIADSTIVEYCTFYNNSLLNVNGSLGADTSWGAALMITGSAGAPVSTPIIRHNIFHDIWGEGPTVRYTTNALFEDNEIYNCFSVALYVQNTRYAKVQRNLVYSTGHMQNDEDRDNAEVGIGLWDESYSEPTVSRVTVINNLVYGCDRNLVNYSGDTVAIVGNTFVNSMSTEANVQMGGGGVTFTKAYFANNIIDENDGTAPINLITVYGSGTNNITFANNGYSRALSGEYELPASDAGDVEDDPELTKGDTGEGELTSLYFVPGTTSPAIGVGQDMDDLLGIYYDTTNIYRDYLQYIRLAPPSIGALEVAGDPPDPAVLPTVATTVITSFTAISATVGGNVIDDGGATVTQRGVCISTSANPTTSDTRFMSGAGEGSFTVNITSLNRGTTYHVRAYAINSEGTSYGSDMSFITPKSSIYKSSAFVKYNGKNLR